MYIIAQVSASPSTRMLQCFTEVHTHCSRIAMWRCKCSRERTPSPNGCSLVLLLLLSSIFFCISTACSDGNCQLLQSCATATDCGTGLYCGNCPALGKTQPICVRGQATLPTSIINGLPFNKYTWIVTHNAFSIVDEPSLTGAQRITFYNQEDSVTNQLRNGVRGLMLDMYDFENDIWLCHSFNGQCYNFTAFQPAINTLKEVEAFLSENPTEIVTIIIEDYVHTSKGLMTVFTAAGLDKYWFPVSKMPKKGDDWPTLTYMLRENYRLVVFTSNSSKEEDEGVAYQWKYMVENGPGDGGLKPGSCPSRAESKPLNSKSASLFLQNYFPSIPAQNEACKEHSTPLVDMVRTCYKAAGNVMANFLAVNYYMRSDGGGVFDAVDLMNGQTLCGCGTVTQCQAGEARGVCKAIAASNTTTPQITSTAGTFSGYVQMTGSATRINSARILVFCSFYFLSVAFLS